MAYLVNALRPKIATVARETEIAERGRAKLLAVDAHAQATRSVLSSIQEAREMLNASSDINGKELHMSAIDGLLADLEEI